jgi:hypothetical protein
MAIEPELKGYLEGIRYRLRLDPAAEKKIVRELYTHIEDRAQELKAAGLSQPEATKSATERFGRPGAIAAEIYKVYSKGSWRVALLAAIPHLLIVACADPSVLGSPGLVVAALLLVALLFSPALLEHKIGHGEGEVWIKAGWERWSEGG